MRKLFLSAFVILTLLFSSPSAHARNSHIQQSSGAAALPSAAHQTETDEYTRYELLAPDSASFKIYYEVTATTAGARSSTFRFAKAVSPAMKPFTTPCPAILCISKSSAAPTLKKIR